MAFKDIDFRTSEFKTNKLFSINVFFYYLLEIANAGKFINFILKNKNEESSIRCKTILKHFLKKFDYILFSSLLSLYKLSSITSSFCFFLFFKNKLIINIYDLSSNPDSHIIFVYGRKFYIIGNDNYFNSQFLSIRKILFEKKIK